MVSVAAAILRKACAFLLEVAKEPVPTPDGVQLRAAEAEKWAKKLAPRRRQKKVVALDNGRPPPAMTTSEIRAACVARAGGQCEACGRRFSRLLPPTMDHWLNGNGRRRQKQSVETCWMLCGTPGMRGTCHHQRQALEPNAALWNERFRAHCDRHAYRFEPHIEHQPLARRA